MTTPPKESLPSEDEVLRRMLSTPPEPRRPASKAPEPKPLPTRGKKP